MSARRRSVGFRARRWSVAVLILALWAALPSGGVGQDLDARVREAPDGWVRFEFEARPGVCGNGDWISVDGERWRYGRHGEGPCEPGPVRIDVRVRAGVVEDLDAEVGGIPRERDPITDLGEVATVEAADFLLDLAETARTEAAEEAIFPAMLARGVETWPRLLAIARGDARTDVRRQAVFWLGQEASERATEGLTSIITDEGEIELREHAVFALSQRPADQAVTALIRIARTNPEPMLRKRAIFWLAQHDEDPRVLAFLEELLTGG